MKNIIKIIIVLLSLTACDSKIKTPPKIAFDLFKEGVDNIVGVPEAIKILKL
ncbi:MAG: hypothetical protein GY936_03930 [Ignavibacteriae bacterium]|nr:hypothetical protein [Ignavibacteriota bacterium]